MIEVITLDLEGTLISSAVSQFPRPYVRQFLDFCLSTGKKLMWLTAVNPEKVQGIVQLLAEEGYFPEAALDIEHVEWIGRSAFKDLELTGYPPEQVVAIDDWKPIYLPEHHSQVIQVECFQAPYSELDEGLLAAQRQLATRLE
jgi:hypothetical protein